MIATGPLFRGQVGPLRVAEKLHVTLWLGLRAGFAVEFYHLEDWKMAGCEEVSSLCDKICSNGSIARVGGNIKNTRTCTNTNGHHNFCNIQIVDKALYILNDKGLHFPAMWDGSVFLLSTRSQVSTFSFSFSTRRLTTIWMVMICLISYFQISWGRTLYFFSNLDMFMSKLT